MPTRFSRCLVPYSAAVALALAALVSRAKAQQDPANLVLNPGFETGDFTDWTSSGDQGSDFVGDSGDYPVNSGNYAAVLGAESPSSLTQTLATVAGQSYELSFYLRSSGLIAAIAANGNPFGPQPAAVTMPVEFQASFDGQLVYDTATDGDPGTSYIQLSFPGLTASSASTLLEFDFENDPSEYFLDDVSVTTVPEPSCLAIMLAGTAFGLGGWRLARRRAGA